MGNQELAHWIVDQRSKKFTDAQIKKNLLGHGYSEEIIQQAFSFIDTQGKKPMQMGQPPSTGGVRIGADHYDLFSVISVISLFFFPLLAIPFAIISLNHLKHDSHLKGKNLAMVGLIVGIFLGVLPLFILLIYILLLILQNIHNIN